MDWITLRHDATGGETRVNNHPDVIAAHEARGWRVVDEEPADPDDAGSLSVPVSTDAAEGASAWVDMVHPDLPHAPPQRVPNHPDAIAGQREVGWTFPEPPAEAVDEAAQAIREEAGKRRGRPTRAELAEAEQRAALEAAAADEPPAAAGGPAQDEQAAVSAAETKE